MSMKNVTTLLFVVACVAGALGIDRSTSGDDCPGGWLTGPCYKAAFRTCRECLAEAHLTAGLGEGDCSDLPCGSFKTREMVNRLA